MRSRLHVNEELEVRRTQGIPDRYPEEAQSRARQRLGIVGQGPQQGGRYGSEVMRNLDISKRLCRGHERELEALATKVITDLYKPILDEFKIRLDIKMASGREIRNLLDTGMAPYAGGPASGRQEYAKKGTDVTPVVKARGQDFSMLIHEAVKGIWLVMSQFASRGGELGKDVAKAFRMSADEPDEWSYGPEIAADLRDFINENKHVMAQEGDGDKYPNLREYVWMYMVNPSLIPTDEFLELMKGILNKTETARKKVDAIINKLVAEMDADKEYEKEHARYQRELAEWERKYGHLQAAAQKPAASSPGAKPDYSKMDKKTLQGLLDKALDDGEFDVATEIAQFLD
jgi:hypothetical protein